MSAAGPRIRTEALSDWHADYDPDDGTLSVMIGVSFTFKTADLPADFRPAFSDALWIAFAHILDDELERLMHHGVGEEIAGRLLEFMEPVRDDLERALAYRLRRMLSQLSEVGEALTRPDRPETG